MEYKEYCNRVKSPCDLLGIALPVRCHDDKIIFNLYGQLNYGTDKQQTNYNALQEALRNLNIYCEVNRLSVAIPYGIGCGLAGGDWEIVYKIIEEIFKDYDVTIYKFQ